MKEVVSMETPPADTDKVRLYTSRGRCILLLNGYQQFKDNPNVFLNDDDEVVGWLPVEQKSGAPGFVSEALEKEVS